MVGSAYLDASGSHANRRDRALVAAGFVVPEATWSKMEPFWDRALRGGHKPLGMYSSAAMERMAFKRTSGWDEKKVAALRHHLIDVLSGRGFHKRGFACGVYRSDWQAVNRRYRLQEHVGGMYAVGMLGLVRLVLQKTGVRTADAMKDCLIYAEEGDAGMNDLRNLLKLEPYKGRFIVVPKRTTTPAGTVRYVRPFEAADLLAYEVRWGREQVARGANPEDFRAAARRIDDKLKARIVWYTQASNRQANPIWCGVVQRPRCAAWIDESRCGGGWRCAIDAG